MEELEESEGEGGGEIEGQLEVLVLNQKYKIEFHLIYICELRRILKLMHRKKSCGCFRQSKKVHPYVTLSS